MRLSIAATLASVSLACALAAGCESGGKATMLAQPAPETAVCTGQIRAFGDSQTVATALTCGGTEKPYVAHADSIAHRFSPCAYSFEAAGGGQMNCSNGTSGPLTYDMTDPANIRVVASLNDGRQMAFTLRDQ
jgi:hypothetical protein